MVKKALLSLIVMLNFILPAHGYELLNTEQLSLALDTYFRADLVNLKNVVDLNSHNKDDHAAYLGIDYSFALSAEFKESVNKLYIKLERNGPYDYSAPVFIQQADYFRRRN